MMRSTRLARKIGARTKLVPGELRIALVRGQVELQGLCSAPDTLNIPKPYEFRV